MTHRYKKNQILILSGLLLALISYESKAENHAKKESGEPSSKLRTPAQEPQSEESKRNFSEKNTASLAEANALQKTSNDYEGIIERVIFIQKQKEDLQVLTKFISNSLRDFQKYEQKEKEIKKTFLKCIREHKQMKNNQEWECAHLQKEEKEAAETWHHKIDDFTAQVRDQLESHSLNPPYFQSYAGIYHKLKKELLQEALTKLAEARESAQRRSDFFNRKFDYEISQKNQSYSLKKKIKTLKNQLNKVPSSKFIVLNNEHFKPLLESFLVYYEFLKLEHLCKEPEELEEIYVKEEDCNLLQPLVDEAKDFINSSKNEIKKMEQHLQKESADLKGQYHQIIEQIKKGELTQAIEAHDKLLDKLKKLNES